MKGFEKWKDLRNERIWEMKGFEKSLKNERVGEIQIFEKWKKGGGGEGSGIKGWRGKGGMRVHEWGGKRGVKGKGDRA